MAPTGAQSPGQLLGRQLFPIFYLQVAPLLPFSHPPQGIPSTSPPFLLGCPYRAPIKGHAASPSASLPSVLSAWAPHAGSPVPGPVPGETEAVHSAVCRACCKLPPCPGPVRVSRTSTGLGRIPLKGRTPKIAHKENTELNLGVARSIPRDQCKCPLQVISPGFSFLRYKGRWLYPPCGVPA